MTRHAVFYTAWRVITFISFYCCSIQRADTYVYSTYACLLVVLKDSWKSVYIIVQAPLSILYIIIIQYTVMLLFFMLEPVYLTTSHMIIFIQVWKK